MVSGTRHKLRNVNDVVVRFNDSSIERVKYHGLLLDTNLSFKQHTKYIQSKVVLRLEILHKVRGICNQSTCLMYKSLIISIIDYRDILSSPRGR